MKTIDIPEELIQRWEEALLSPNYPRWNSLAEFATTLAHLADTKSPDCIEAAALRGIAAAAYGIADNLTIFPTKRN